MGHCKICGIVLNHTSYTHCKLHYWERHWEGMTGQQLIDECVNRTNDTDRRGRKKAAERLVEEAADDELFDLKNVRRVCRFGFGNAHRIMGSGPYKTKVRQKCGPHNGQVEMTTMSVSD